MEATELGQLSPSDHLDCRLGELTETPPNFRALSAVLNGYLVVMAVVVAFICWELTR